MSTAYVQCTNVSMESDGGGSPPPPPEYVTRYWSFVFTQNVLGGNTTGLMWLFDHVSQSQSLLIVTKFTFCVAGCSIGYM